MEPPHGRKKMTSFSSGRFAARYTKISRTLVLWGESVSPPRVKNLTRRQGVNSILVVASRQTTLDSLQELIEQRGFPCLVAHSQREALRLIRRCPPDLVIVDRTSLRCNGAKLCRALRRAADIPLVTIVRTQEEAAASGGASCLVKPYTSQQLMGCIRRTLRKHPAELLVASLRLNLRTRTLWLPHCPEPHRLTPKLFALLRFFMAHPGQLIDRATLMAHVWHTEFVEDTRTLDVHIHWLREVIEPDPTQPIYLLTVRGGGYRLAEPPAPAVLHTLAPLEMWVG